MATILVVDDDEDLRQMLRLILEQMNHSVIEARNGLEAAQMAHDGRPDLVLLDITMPVMNGYEALARIRADSRIRDTPVIMITGHGQPMDVVRSFEFGVFAYVMKPVQLDELRARVNQALEIESREARNL